MLNIQRDFLDNVLQTLLEHHCDVTLTTTLPVRQMAVDLHCTDMSDQQT